MALFNRRQTGFYKHLADQDLAKFTREGGLKRWLRYLAKYDVESMYHGFNDVSVANLGWSTAAAGTAGVQLAIPSTKLLNGAAVAESGTDDNAASSAIHHLTWNGDQNCGMMARVKFSAVTSLSFDVGFVDAVPGAAGSAISDVDTPAATATDCAVLHMDTDQTLTTMAFVTAGSTFTTTKTTLASPALTTPTADTYMNIMIQLVGNAAYCWVNGVHVASHTGDKVEGGNLLAPWLYVRARAGSANRKLTADFVMAWQDRA